MTLQLVGVGVVTRANCSLKRRPHGARWSGTPRHFGSRITACRHPAPLCIAQSCLQGSARSPKGLVSVSLSRPRFAWLAGPAPAMVHLCTSDAACRHLVGVAGDDGRGQKKPEAWPHPEVDRSSLISCCRAQDKQWPPGSCRYQPTGWDGWLVLLHDVVIHRQPAPHGCLAGASRGNSPSPTSRPGRVRQERPAGAGRPLIGRSHTEGSKVRRTTQLGQGEPHGLATWTEPQGWLHAMVEAKFFASTTRPLPELGSGATQPSTSPSCRMSMSRGHQAALDPVLRAGLSHSPPDRRRRPASILSSSSTCTLCTHAAGGSRPLMHVSRTSSTRRFAVGTAHTYCRGLNSTHGSRFLLLLCPLSRHSPAVRALREPLRPDSLPADRASDPGCPIRVRGEREWE